MHQPPSLTTRLLTTTTYHPSQGDRERRRGMAISPLCDRGEYEPAKAQIGFIQCVPLSR